MGSLYMGEVMGIKNPRVGLLSIGEEDSKGNSQVMEVRPLLKAAPFNFIGNVEGRDMFNGHCDVAVCDGFVGNIVLKTAEGISNMIMSGIKESFRRGSLFEKVGGLLSRPTFHRFRKKVSADEQGGGPLLGVNGIFIITHGKAGRVMIKNAIRLCYENVKHDMVKKLAAVIEAGPGKEA
jgi:glycerol-3-phosphate acyltransferase PlsX